jgi:dTDP-glucose pyrophosphorylase
MYPPTSRDCTLRKDIENFNVSEHQSIREVIAVIDKNRCGIALVVNSEGRLLDTVTDGDIRRALLANLDLDLPIERIAPRRSDSPYPKPITAGIEADRNELLKIMQDTGLNRIPLLDQKEKVVGLVTLEDLLPSESMHIEAVIMAGGLGKRLRPLTEEVPKPMLPIGGRPLMERMIDQLRECGIRRVNVTTHYKRETIESHFGDGSDFGVDLNYVTEERPLGTAGSLSKMESSGPLLVVNGDILTQVDFSVMAAHHRKSGADLTLGVRQYDLRIPYGVVHCEGERVTALEEKPELKVFVNAGIYLLEPSARRFIPEDEPLDMTDLIDRLIANGRKVSSFLVHEYWLDIGDLQSYEQAQVDVENGRVEL